jgi:hypothetical protein
MTNIALTDSLTNNISNHIKECYFEYSIPKIVQLLNTSTEEEFNSVFLEILKEHLENPEVEFKTKQSRNDFISDIFKGNTIDVIVLIPSKKDVYYAGGYKAVTEHEAELLKEFGVTVAKVKEVSKSESWVTIFWSV